MKLGRVRIVARVGGLRSPRSRAFAASALVHVGLALLIVLSPSFGRDRIPVEDFIVVTPVGSLGPAIQAAPEPPAEVDEPAPGAPPEGATVTEKVPEPTKKKPRKKKEPPKPKPLPRQPQPSSGTPASGAPTPGGSGSGGVTDVTALDLEGAEFAWYRDRLSAALKSKWRQPVLEGVRESIAVTIAFRILRDGSVRDPRIEGTSGVPSLDRSALRAVIESDPLPALPPNWRRPEMSARFVFRWYP